MKDDRVREAWVGLVAVLGLVALVAVFAVTRVVLERRLAHPATTTTTGRDAGCVVGVGEACVAAGGGG
jgi:hypothetical protein